MAERIAEEHWPERIYIGGDEDRPWLIWWRSPREDFPTRCYVPASPHPAEQQRDALLADIEDHRTQQNGAPRGNVTAADRNLYRAAERVRKGQ